MPGVYAVKVVGQVCAVLLPEASSTLYWEARPVSVSARRRVLTIPSYQLPEEVVQSIEDAGGRYVP